MRLGALENLDDGARMNESDSAAPVADTGPALRADPLADDTLAAILDRCPGEDGPDGRWATIGLLNRLIAGWQINGELATWRADAGTPAHIAAALERYLAAAMALPAWADPARIARAEVLFMDMSMMSCTLLFCASLPECYVVPDLAGVLHAAGQLEQNADYRIRSTAAMLFPVMMHGGLTGAAGGGVAQALKVRLIHATIRYLILRGSPQAVLAGAVGLASSPVIAALPPQGPSMQQTLYAHGWDLNRYGLPCNQEQLAYTLLTFHYVFLRGLRSLGIGLSGPDEEAYLHAWNVLGHLLGIERALTADSMAAAAALFGRLQAGGRANPYLPDSRPALGAALMQTMEKEIPFALLKPFPVLLTRYLCGKASSRDLGITARVSWLSRGLFAALMGTTRLVDRIARLFLPEFSLCRMLTRVVGYRFTARVLMDQTRPLKLPQSLLNQVDSVVRTWHDDNKAPRWVNKLEARLSRRRPGQVGISQ
jgi:hypothetical protein